MRAFLNFFCSRENPLFFRKDGSLDFGPACWASAYLTAIVLVVVDFVSRGYRLTPVTGSLLAGIIGVTSIAGAAAERAFWLSKSTLPGELARGVAEAGRGEEPLSRLVDDPDA